MKPARMRPVVQLFVCCNARSADDPLQSACGTHGALVLNALKRKVSAQGRLRDVWVSKTACLGQCPREGCSVVLSPSGEQWVDVTESDCDALLAHSMGTKRG